MLHGQYTNNNLKSCSEVIQGHQFESAYDTHQKATLTRAL